MREKQTIEFSLRLFTLRVRVIGKRTLMQNKNFVTWQKMTQQQVEMKKKELEQFSVQAQNPLKSIMQNTEKKSWANQDFFLSENVDPKQKIIPKKTIKKHSSKQNYSPTNETDVEMLEKLNDTKPNLIKTFTDPSNGMIVDVIINVNDWEVKKAYN